VREKLDKPTDQLASKYGMINQMGGIGGKGMFESLN
jgi:hypothetical protein